MKYYSEIQKVMTAKIAHKYCVPSLNSIVFTNGCFDVLHPGHISLLQFCAAHGEVVVGVNSDKSVRKIKGCGRPIIPERDRLYQLNALECVSAIVLFDAETPYNLIRTIRPDIIVKGIEYLNKPVVGRNFVEKCGGKVLLAPQYESYSTTRILKANNQR